MIMGGVAMAPTPIDTRTTTTTAILTAATLPPASS
jgi:hypothetical protein